MQDLQSSVENLFDRMSRLERDLETKLVKWTGYEDSSATFQRWLTEVHRSIYISICVSNLLRWYFYLSVYHLSFYIYNYLYSIGDRAIEGPADPEDDLRRKEGPAPGLQGPTPGHQVV